MVKHQKHKPSGHFGQLTEPTLFVFVPDAFPGLESCSRRIPSVVLTVPGLLAELGKFHNSQVFSGSFFGERDGFFRFRRGL